MKAKKEGTVKWYVGIVFFVIGLLFMFTREEIGDLAELFNRLKTLINNKE